MKILKTLINIFFSYPILSPAIMISCLYLLIAMLYISPKYTSNSIISISEKENGVTSAFGLVSSFIGSQVKQSVGDLKNYLESDQAATELSKLINIEEFFSNNKVDLISKFKPQSSSTLKQYLENVLILKVDSSGNLLIQTNAFSPENAYKFNLAVIMLSSNYFDRRQQIASRIAFQKDICQYKLSTDGFENIVLEELMRVSELDFKTSSLNNFNSANEMLLNKAELFSELCSSKKSDQPFEGSVLPNKTIRDVNSESLKNLIGNMYSNAINFLTMSDAVEIVAEPSINFKAKKEHIFVNTFLIFLFSIMLISSLKIIYNLRDDFKT